MNLCHLHPLEVYRALPGPPEASPHAPINSRTDMGCDPVCFTKMAWLLFLKQLKLEYADSRGCKGFLERTITQWSGDSAVRMSGPALQLQPQHFQKLKPSRLHFLICTIRIRRAVRRQRAGDPMRWHKYGAQHRTSRADP